MTNKERVRVSMDEIKVKSGELVDKVKEIIEEGNARRVIIKKEDRTMLEFPLSVGVGGATAAIFFTPVLAAVGALAALVTDVKILVERVAEAEVARGRLEGPQAVERKQGEARVHGPSIDKFPLSVARDHIVGQHRGKAPNSLPSPTFRDKFDQGELK